MCDECNIVAITWARNEEDIIESFVRHNAPFVSRMIIILHRTEDSSLSILNRLKEEGLNIEIRQDQSVAHRQSGALTDLMRGLMVEEKPDWILPLDADEFLCGDLVGELKKVPAGQVVLLPWRTYIPTPDDDSCEISVLNRIAHCRAEEIPQYYKILIPQSLASDPNAVIPLGSHRLCGVDADEYKEHGLSLAHFPVRSEKQLRNKILKGWESHLANPDRNPGEIYQWEELVGRCRDPKSINKEELRDIALNYAYNGETTNLKLNPICVGKPCYTPSLSKYH
ncbi:glycosyltransferase family 2 protein [Patescibacteria group bacterium]|nr:glycosyltransferase family 2 protein [Patescibacteria group bacterium]